MTRRELAAPVEDVESQSRDAEVSDGFSERSSTLPTYEDVVLDTPALRSEDSKGDYGKMPEEEQPLLTGGSEDEGGSTKQEGQTKSTLKRYFWIMAVVVLWNIVARSFHLFPASGKHTPPPSEPESADSSWPSPREIRVHETTNTIHGSYPLYDLLELTTTTGQIHATIEPKAGNKTAVVNIRSTTGAIYVRFAKSVFNNADEKGVLERVYRTQMDTKTGQIHVEVFHGGAGGETVLTTKTGMLDVRVIPIGDQASRIETTTVTGLNRVTVEAPMQGTTLKNLTAIHKTMSTGQLDINYPRIWEGRVHAWCRGTGLVDVHGEGLNMQGGGKNVYAWRGEDAVKNGRIIEVVSEGTGTVRFKA
ncbi:hypothetical protein GJ744_006272 [Endocarpon pusillum]|uniref:Uncharacterized protein n=1 Tax=Endocarpon pusillum TaxID=364733 RepID=A0A8H7AK90_9EURO|nr:hypothetical protein GJ744_006272 [Endocarpon pusillum]